MIKKMKVITAVLLVSLLIANVFTVHAAQDEGYVCARDEIAQWIIATAAILNWENFEFYRLFGKSRYELKNFYIDAQDVFTDTLIDIVKNWPTELQNIELESGLSVIDFVTMDHRVEFNLITHSKLMLKGWNIRNAEDLKNQIDGLLNGGHNARFIEEYKALSELMDEGVVIIRNTYEDMGCNIYSHLQTILGIRMTWEDSNIIGWDLFRIGTLISWGYAAGFIEREEAYELMVPAINLLKDNFICWEDAAYNYIEGFLWWAAPHREIRAEVYTEFFRRRNIFNAMRVVIPNLFDDSMFDNAHITSNFQRPVNP